ncbi:MAG: hypothetical protein RAO94_08175 [Candidatus Stygibacter australis]|nr:hypothetical protein [Candidatus Stygibacter australis]MDP8322313.1 hypothetical protein [Candidatus Stygibacter australis]
MQLLLIKQIERKLINFSLIITIVLIISGCSSSRYVCFTAANTGIPVLLSKIDRINNNQDPGLCETVKYTDDQMIYATTLYRKRIISENTVITHLDSTNIDAKILKNTLGDKNLNVNVIELEVNNLWSGVYLLVFLAKEEYYVKMTAISQEASDLVKTPILNKE